MKEEMPDGLRRWLRDCFTHDVMLMMGFLLLLVLKKRRGGGGERRQRDGGRENGGGIMVTMPLGIILPSFLLCFLR